VIPPPGWVARKQGYNNLDFLVKSKRFYILIVPLIEPIEQNVHGSKGVYELVYFLKDSRPIERFKKMAMDSEKHIQGKPIDAIEKLVLLILYHSYCSFYSFGEP
jgi:hypothetical protein